jgi:hypothetical protein
MTDYRTPGHGQTVQVLNSPGEHGPAFPPPKRPSITIHGVFSQLKWSVLDAPSKVEMFSLDADDRPQWASLSTNAIADEPATAPPNYRLQIRLEPLQSWENWQQSETEPPELLLIENNDDQPISVKQFIQAVHDYAVSLREPMCRCWDIYEEEEDNARFYLDYIGVQDYLEYMRGVDYLRGLDNNGDVREETLEIPCPKVEVGVLVDTDEDGHQLKCHLEFIEQQYQKRHRSG